MFPKIVGFPPESSILIGLSIINHPFWGTPIFGNTHILWPHASHHIILVRFFLNFDDLTLENFRWTIKNNYRPIKDKLVLYVPGSKLPLFAYIIWDGHQPNSRGVYTHYKDSLLKVKVGWIYPQYKDFRPWHICTRIKSHDISPFSPTFELPWLNYPRYRPLQIKLVLPSFESNMAPWK